MFLSLCSDGDHNDSPDTNCTGSTRENYHCFSSLHIIGLYSSVYQSMLNTITAPMVMIPAKNATDNIVFTPFGSMYFSLSLSVVKNYQNNCGCSAENKCADRKPYHRISLLFGLMILKMLTCRCKR